MFSKHVQIWSCKFWPLDCHNYNSSHYTHTGAGIHVTHSESSYISSRPNNSIILTDTNTHSYYSRPRRMGFYCCSNSTSAVGTFVGLNSRAYSGRITLSRPGNTGCMYLYFDKRYRSSSQNTLDSSEQGIYTCRLPDATGRNIDVNVGIYRESYHGKSNKNFSPHNYNYETAVLIIAASYTE